jgi:hypothetical protein
MEKELKEQLQRILANQVVIFKALDDIHRQLFGYISVQINADDRVKDFEELSDMYLRYIKTE